ncbi:unnamed protein product [Psylliodes chrysocephalus]|uniref:HAT C-terminal dimerisation domain-containing protein n=1 Tax=Psylliodes chrysocephalus TaxID=3402493 RepID=A0A9P0D0Q8_9CUCU|nr:unnamed protein product [Psylliodes chrysocephala]
MGRLEISQGIYNLSVENIYPNIQKALRIFLSIPVTIATCECSFRKLKLVKSYLRSCVGQQRTNKYVYNFN